MARKKGNLPSVDFLAGLATLSLDWTTDLGSASTFFSSSLAINSAFLPLTASPASFKRIFNSATVKDCKLSGCAMI